MKLTTLLLLSIIQIAQTLSAQILTFMPTHPLPGETIQIEYRLNDLPITQVEDIQMVAYFFTDFSIGASEVKELQWTRKNDHFRAEVVTTNDAAALLIRILPIDATENDASTGVGYTLSFYQPDRMTLRRGAICAQAQLYASYGNRKGFQQSIVKADSLFAQVFTYPELIDDENWYQYFLYYKMNINLATSQKLAEQWSKEILEKDNPSVEEISACYHVVFVQSMKQPLGSLKY